MSTPKIDSDSSESNLNTGSDVSQDDIFGLLSNHRRRYVLHYLQQNGEHASLGDLAEQIAAWENDTAVEEVSATERKRVYTSLQQFHLPKMADTGVVEFDAREGTVTLGPEAEATDIYLEVVQGGGTSRGASTTSGSPW